MPRRAPAATLDELREKYAGEITRAGWVTDPRIERAFAAIPREGFLTPPPWTFFPPGGDEKTPTINPADLYDDVLVVLDGARGVNNGQPSLHAAWLAAVDPRHGDTAIHVGAGTGYYTAILAMLVLPGGRVVAYEVHEALASLARHHLQPFDHVELRAESAFGVELPPADVIYVNAGAVAPDPGWLRALKAGGRLIFPWQPRRPGGVALVVRREAGGFSAKPTMAVGFIPCVGAEPRQARAWPAPEAVERTRSVWLEEQRVPDETATAVYEGVWFSCEAVETGGEVGVDAPPPESL
jgi:protein-L-isoaspartate(D-aspartate) O-methyltransferase